MRSRTVKPRGRRVSPNVPSLFAGVAEWSNDLLGLEVEFAVLGGPLFEVFAECLASYGHVVSVDQVVLQEIRQNLCHSVTC